MDNIDATEVASKIDATANTDFSEPNDDDLMDIPVSDADKDPVETEKSNDNSQSDSKEIELGVVSTSGETGAIPEEQLFNGPVWDLPVDCLSCARAGWRGWKGLRVWKLRWPVHPELNVKSESRTSLKKKAIRELVQFPRNSCLMDLSGTFPWTASAVLEPVGAGGRASGFGSFAGRFIQSLT